MRHVERRADGASLEHAHDARRHGLAVVQQQGNRPVVAGRFVSQAPREAVGCRVQLRVGQWSAAARQCQPVGALFHLPFEDRRN
jgi:hypothetical protein